MPKRTKADDGPGGLVIVDKPAGWTSHDVVGRMRRLARTRRVGHAGTLDPMATGVLVIGVEKSTRLLGHLALTRKTYEATIRLGQSTVTDDAEGEVTATADPAAVANVSDDMLAGAIASLTGDIMQRPSAVSAIKVDGVRSYKRVRDGEDVELAARPVTVFRFDVTAVRRAGDFIDLDATVECSSGTYIRALARDLGRGLGVGGHLTMLRRTAVGPYTLDQAHSLEDLTAAFEKEEPLPILPLDDAARAAFPARELTEAEAALVANGGFLAASGTAGEPVAVFGPQGRFLALYEDVGSKAKPVAVFG